MAGELSRQGSRLQLAYPDIGLAAPRVTVSLTLRLDGTGRLLSARPVPGQPAPDALLQHDMDASPLFPRFEIPLYGRSSFPCDADLSERLAQACRTSLTVAGATGRMPGLHRGLIVSGDQFVSTAHSASRIQSGQSSWRAAMKVSAASKGPSNSTVSQGGPSSASIPPVAAPQSVHAGACFR
jgi:hypothetical protein